MPNKVANNFFKNIFKNFVFKNSPWDDIDEEDNIFNRKRKGNNGFNFDNFQFNFNDRVFYLLAGLLVLIWLASGFYILDEGEQSAVLRFGKYNRTGMPGPNYRLPFPLESHLVEEVNKSRQVDVGYRSFARGNKDAPAQTRDVPTEMAMLTGDENIVLLQTSIQWHIKDLKDYLFSVQNQEKTIKSVSESAIRDVISNTKISSVLSIGKEEIENQILDLIQAVLDRYNAGIEIERVKFLKAEPPQEVIEAYRDVQTAEADKEKLINEAKAYANDIIPKARGKAAQVVAEAEGYSAYLIEKAAGDAARFNALYKQYIQNKNITKNRLYLETVEKILRDADKVLVGSEAVLPHMSVTKPELLFKGQE